VVREKSGKMNYYNYSVATSIVQTEICNNGVQGKVGEFDHDWRVATLINITATTVPYCNEKTAFLGKKKTIASF